MSEDILLWMFGIVVLIFLGYAALQGIVAQQLGDKRTAKEVKNLQGQMREFIAAREAAQKEFNQSGQCYFADVKKVS